MEQQDSTSNAGDIGSRTGGTTGKPDAPANNNPHAQAPAAPFPRIHALAPLAASGVAFGAHALDWPEWFGVDTATPVADSPAYPGVLGAVAAGWFALAVAGAVFPALRRKIRHHGPLLAAGTLAAAVWQAFTAKLGVLPMPYFPGPDRVFSVLVEDAEPLAEGALASLRLLSAGFACGATAGFLLGVWFGWNRVAAYWGMPVLKFFGPVPAPAWIPFALILFPSSNGVASMFILALASLFPMVVLTASGVASTRHSHLEIARTLGATPWQLIVRVAIPSALPSIFTGLFMALSASFITLIIAEAIGVKAGLGFYINWAQNFAEYNKIYASLLLMVVFFSSIMSALFLVRDRVLRWQQGLIKW